MSTTTNLLLFFLLFISGVDSLPIRRILHQPFFPSTDSTPPPSPSPPTTSTPSSSSNPQQPFFPSSPTSPPPPQTLSPSPFASFPANISSLILPHSPSPSSPSKKLLAVTLSLSLSALLIASLSLFFFFRHRNNHHPNTTNADDNKSTSTTTTTMTSNPFYHRPSTNNRPPPPPPPPQLLKPTTNSSEFLYLGTLANSITPNPQSQPHPNPPSITTTRHPRKLDSPELHPLPPLHGRHHHTNHHQEDDDHEEFYSPRGSASGRESGGSGSRRTFEAAVVRAQSDRFIHTHPTNHHPHSDQTTSSSSSSSGSPARSASLSISPPVSNSPKDRSNPKSSPEFIEMQFQPPAASPSLPEMSFSPPLSISSGGTSPDRGMDTIKEEEEAEESPLLSNASSSSRMSSPPQSPRLSTLTGKLTKVQEEERQWGVLGLASPPLSTGSAPTRKSSPIASLTAFFRGGKRKDSESEASTSITNSPDSHHSPTSPISSTGSSSRNSRSYPASPMSKNSGGISPRLLSASCGNSPRLPNVSDRKISHSPVGITDVTPPAPPPPPPPPPVSRRSQSPPVPPPVPRVTESVVYGTPPKPVGIVKQAEESPVESGGLGSIDGSGESSQKLKLKPLHWDKVRASSDREMVWDQLRSSSFKLNEEMIETLFVVNNPSQNQKDMPRKSIQQWPMQDNRVLDPKKAQNIAILLRALNVTMEEVCEALLEGNAETLGTELLESLLKMAPSKEEERKLKEYKDDSPVKLGHAEKFLKAVVDIPFAFKRVEAMLYMANFESEIEYLKKSFDTLEAACEELRSSRMFLKLLEAVLKTGNRMNVGTNRGDAHAFKLDTLLKLVDVKGADGKTTLLHFVVQEISRTEGQRLSTTDNQPLNDEARCRKLGLQVVSALTSELTNVKKAAAMDSDVLSNDVVKLTMGLTNLGEIVRLNDQNQVLENNHKFSESLNRFIKMAEEEIFRVQAQERVGLSLVKEITEYFHGNSAKEEAHPFRIFMVVRDFLNILGRVCKEVGMINERTIVSSAHKFPVPVNPMLPVPMNPLLPQVLPGFPGRRQSSSSDDGSGSP